MITLEQIKTLLNGLTQKIPPFVKPDWNENDASSPHYIKNRPFYKKDGKVAKRISAEFLPSKLPSQFVGDVKKQAKETTSNFKVVTQQFYPFQNDDCDVLPLFNNQYGEVRALWNPMKPWDGYPASNWSYFEFPSSEEIVVAPGNVYEPSSAYNHRGNPGLYLWCYIYHWENDVGYCHHICQIKNRLTYRGGADGTAVFFGTASELELVITHGVTGEVINAKAPSPGNLVRIDKNGVAVYSGDINTTIGPFGTIQFCPLRLTSTYAFPLLYVRKDPHFVLPELYPFYLNVRGKYLEYEIGTIFGANCDSNLRLFNRDDNPNYVFMANAGKLYFMLDNKYKVKVTQCARNYSNDDTKTVNGNDSVYWWLKFEGTTDLFEEDGMRYSVTVKGSCWSYYTPSPCFWMKLTEFTKVLLPSTPSYTSEDEGKVLKIVNGVPTWVSE